MKKIAKFVAEPTFANEREYNYSILSILRRERFISKCYFLMSFTSPVMQTIFWLAGYMGNFEFFLIVTFQLIQSVVGVYFLRGNKPTVAMRFAVLTCFVTMQMVWMIAARINYASGDPSPPLAGLWLVNILFGCLFFPFRSRVHHFIFAYMLITGAAGMYGFPDYGFGVGALVIAQLVGQNMNIIAQRFLKKLTILQYREQSRYLPQKVILDTAREGASVETVFEPRNRFCACVCSDWRNFQAVASDEVAKVLGDKLSSYYTGIADRLSKDLPNGNFFMDWIADELFVVIFADTEEADAEIVEKAFDIGTWLLSHRRSFARHAGYPTGIDVGISAGIASVGVFGPSGGVKATAFGAIPGHARRLQGFAKQLRGDYGDQDRLVISKLSGEIIGMANSQCSRLDVGENMAIRDVNEDQVYVWPRLGAKAKSIESREAA